MLRLGDTVRLNNPVLRQNMHSLLCSSAQALLCGYDPGSILNMSHFALYSALGQPPPPPLHTHPP